MHLISIRRLVFSYIFIFIIIKIDQSTNSIFYPLTVLALSHLYLTIILLGHEGAHGLLHRNSSVNTLIARFFCHFPFFISHNHYRFLHMHHHRFENTSRDYDYPFYQKKFSSYYHFAQVSLINTFTFRYLYHFITYFNGINKWLIKRNEFNYKNDYFQFLLYWGITIIIITFSRNWLNFFIYLFIPNWLILFWIYTLNLYQHVNNKTHNIILSNRFLKEFLFPLNINYHLTHHQTQNLPYYQLETNELSKRDFISISKINDIIFKQQN